MHSFTNKEVLNLHVPIHSVEKYTCADVRVYVGIFYHICSSFTYIVSLKNVNVYKLCRLCIHVCLYAEYLCA